MFDRLHTHFRTHVPHNIDFDGFYTYKSNTKDNSKYIYNFAIL
jgi:hypothetical protein